MAAVLHHLRRLLNRSIGSGPWTVRPASTLFRLRTDELRRGVELPESFAGCVGSIELPSQRYRPGLALLGGERICKQQVGGRPRFAERGFSAAYTLPIWTLQDAVVCGHGGLVYCPHQRIAVAETARRWLEPALHHPLLGAWHNPLPVPLPGLSLHLLGLDDAGFYHFLHESIARLGPLGPWRECADWFLISGPSDATRARWLAAAGVPLDRVRWIGNRDSVRCEQVLFTPLPLRTAQPTVAQIAALRSVFATHSKGSRDQPTRQLWISRADCQRRHLQWEDDILKRLPGFEKITLSELNPDAQIELFASASAIVGPHGAGFANLAFASPGGALVELFDVGSRWDPLYGRLADCVNWRHAWAGVRFDAPADAEALVERLAAFLASPVTAAPDTPAAQQNAFLIVQ